MEVASNAKVGQPLAFTLSGTGVLSDAKTENKPAQQPAIALNGKSTVRESRNVAAPIPHAAAPERSAQSQWYILAGLGLLLATSLTWITRRSRKRRMRHPVPAERPSKDVLSDATSELNDGGKLILNDLKEQLFRLEVEHKQNRISQQDYEKALTALRQNLEWVMLRKSAAI